jgi:hypothetical protein
MPTPVPPKQRAHRILRRLKCFRSEVEPPANLGLRPADILIGAIRDRAFLSEAGAYLPIGVGWQFAEYKDIAVSYPPKSQRAAPLILRTPNGLTALLAGDPERWEVGRFFMRCREDQLAA